jgi:hypothetical protein
MSRIALPFVVVALTFPAVEALQMQTHGVSASVTSPSSDGQTHGVPSSITSPTPVQGARTMGDPNSRVIFGNPHTRHKRSEIVPVPVFYPVYIDTSNAPAQPAAESNAAESETAASDTDALRDAYNRGAQDALTELRARQRDRVAEMTEKPRSKPAARDEKKAAARDDAETVAETTPRAPEPTPAAQAGPPTVFIFKDGRKLETQNYAIAGSMLYDFSVKGLHKIRLAELDLDATRKINEDSGTPITLP